MLRLMGGWTDERSEGRRALDERATERRRERKRDK